jgi:multidrug resistance efflux pump
MAAGSFRGGRPVTAGVLMAWTVACSSGGAAPPSGPAEVPGTDLVVRRGVFNGRFLLTGELEAVRSDKLIVPRIPNWQTTIRWMEAEGALVKAGQHVVELDTSSFAADFKEKQLNVDVLGGELEQAAAERDANRNEKDFQVAQRRVALEKAKVNAEIPAEFLRGQEWQDNQMAMRRAETALEKAQEDLDSSVSAAEENVLQKRIELDKARRELGAARQAMEGMALTAPRDGILVVGDHPWEGRKLQIGDSVWVGLAVVSLPDLSEMRVAAKLSDVDDGRIVPGLPAVCTLDAFPEKTYPGRVTVVMPVAQEQARRSLRRAYDVRVELEASDVDRMRPGMSVKVEVTPPPRQGVLLAPRAGLDWSTGSPRALLATGGESPVKLGPCNAQVCVVEDGVKEGDRLRSRG